MTSSVTAQPITSSHPFQTIGRARTKPELVSSLKSYCHHFSRKTGNTLEKVNFQLLATYLDPLSYQQRKDILTNTIVILRAPQEGRKKVVILGGIINEIQVGKSLRSDQITCDMVIPNELLKLISASIRSAWKPISYQAKIKDFLDECHWKLSSLPPKSNALEEIIIDDYATKFLQAYFNKQIELEKEATSLPIETYSHPENLWAKLENFNLKTKEHLNFWENIELLCFQNRQFSETHIKMHDLIYTVFKTTKVYMAKQKLIVLVPILYKIREFLTNPKYSHINYHLAQEIDFSLQIVPRVEIGKEAAEAIRGLVQSIFDAFPPKRKQRKDAKDNDTLKKKTKNIRWDINLDLPLVPSKLRRKSI